MKCPKCHSDNPDTKQFCGDCGTQLKDSEDPQRSFTKTIETPSSELTTGVTFADRYQIVEKLGQGGMGSVYRARDVELDEDIALKLIKPEISSDQKTVGRFKGEIKLARKIVHKNVGRVYELMEHEGVRFISMEYVPGEDLKSFIRRSGRLAIPKAIDVAKQICEGLAEAHKLGVVHRDLKPSNIMIDREGNARIMDFGIARSAKTEGITGTGVMIGTPSYMSPEQVDGKDVDLRSDIYSLGVILYEMVTGALPFEGDSSLSIAYKHKNEKPPKPITKNAQIPLELNQLILKCLEKKQSSRYQTTRDICSDLTRIQDGISTSRITVKETRVGSSLFPKSIKKLALPLGIVVVAALFIIGYFLLPSVFRSSEAPQTADEQSQQRTMLVVLPFENLGEAQDESLSSLITFDLTTKLAKIRDLGVINYSNARHYERSGKMISEIGEFFGVDYVLEGNIQWLPTREGANSIQITPQLIRVSDETYVWTDRFDFEEPDIVKIQTEISQKVIQYTGVEILDKERYALELKHTDNNEAYRAYVRGIEYLDDFGWSEDGLQEAVFMLERAVRLDPNFALAYASLSHAHAKIVQWNFDASEERISKAKAAIDRAFELDPELPQAHMELGTYYYYCHKEYDKALAELRIAEKDLPNHPRMKEIIAWILRRKGDFEKSNEYFIEAHQLNPQDPQIALNYAISLQVLRRFSEADRYYDIAISNRPDQLASYFFKVTNLWSWMGTTGEARAVLDKLPDSEILGSKYYLYLQHIYEKDYQGAINLLPSDSTDFLKYQYLYMPWDVLIALAYHLMSEPELARQKFESSRILLEKELELRPMNPFAHSALGLVYAGLGNKDRALEEGRAGMELYSVSKDALVGPQTAIDFIHICIMVGEYDTALEQLEYALSIPSLLSLNLLKLDPWYEPLYELPRFKRLTQKEF